MNEDFGQVYDQYIERIYRFIFLKVTSQETAEDLCADVFVRVMNQMEKTRIENIQAFLYQIARNTLADYYRERAKFRVVPVEEIGDIIDPPEGIIRQAAVHSDMDRIRENMAELEDEEQNLIIWRYLDELSIPEIAQLTGKTEGNVRVGIHRALQELKEKMSGQEKEIV
ncbi:MAG: sigma-70 family RNA polymerase sigma factor [Patescibacteria group bacterium]